MIDCMFGALAQAVPRQGDGRQYRAARRCRPSPAGVDGKPYVFCETFMGNVGRRADARRPGGRAAHRRQPVQRAGRDDRGRAIRCASCATGSCPTPAAPASYRGGLSIVRDSRCSPTRRRSTCAPTSAAPAARALRRRSGSAVAEHDPRTTAMPRCFPSAHPHGADAQGRSLPSRHGRWRRLWRPARARPRAGSRGCAGGKGHACACGRRLRRGHCRRPRAFGGYFRHR